MTGKTHLIIGAAAGAALALILQTEPVPGLAMVAAGAVGGLLPDLDSPNSMASQRVGPLRWLLFWIPHRTLTHSILAMLVVSFLSVTVGVMAYPVAAGYISHVGADMMTVKGVPLAYPVWDRKFHLLPLHFRLTTGGIVESLLLGLVLLGLVLLCLELLGVDIRTTIKALL